MTDNTATLIEKARGGDRVAIEQLLVTHSLKLRSHIARRLPTRLQATVTVEDVVQETLTDAYLKINKLRDASEGAFVNWLKTIAEVTLLRLLRAENAQNRGWGVRRRQFATDSLTGRLVDMLEKLPGDGATASRAGARKEAVAALQVALAGLPTDQRQAIQLHLLQGKSLEETAAAMECTPASVRSLVHRGKQKFAEAMGRASVWLSQR